MSSTKKLIRYTTAATAALVAISLIGYLVSRIRSSSQVVSVEYQPENARDRPWSGALEIGAYNIAHGRGGEFGASNWDGGTLAEKRERLEKIGELASSLDLDVIVLNEIDFSSPWSGHLDQAEIIARAGGYPYIARQRSIDFWLPLAQMRFGNAILSRFPITGVDFMPFEPYLPLQKIVAGNHDSMVAHVALPDGESVAVWAIHLEYRSRATRIEAAKKILEHSENLGKPVLLAGDFNSDYPEDRGGAKVTTAISVLLDSGRFDSFPKIADRADNFTFPSANPDRVIDWILFPPDWQAVSGSVERNRISDHLLVTASLVRSR